MPSVHLSDHRGVSIGRSGGCSRQCACHPHGRILWLLSWFPVRLLPGHLSRRWWWGEEWAEQSSYQFQQRREWQQHREAQCPEAHTQRHHHHDLQRGERINAVIKPSDFRAHIPSIPALFSFHTGVVQIVISLFMCFARWHWHSWSSGPPGSVGHSKW